MRVLFATYPEKTVFYSMVPLAWALRTAGHEVYVASQPAFGDTITRAGLTAVPVGRDRHTQRLSEINPEQTEAERPGLPDPYNAAVRDPHELDWATMRDGYEYLLRNWHKLDNFPMMAELVSFARAWEPDLVLWEPSTFAGAVAARACGAAHGRLLWSVDVFGVTRERFLRLAARRPVHDHPDPLGEWLAAHGRRYGFEYGEDLVTGQFTIDQLPDSLRMEADLAYVPVQYVPYNASAVVPRWLWEPPARPRVAVSLGTSSTELFAGYAVHIQSILDALADLDIDVIATVADRERERLGRVPDNARVLPWVPLHALAASCSVVINHAGPGTSLTTAVCGVPQLHLPWDFDEPELARRIAARGAALVLRPDEASGRSVRDSVSRLMSEPRFRNDAAGLCAEIRSLPTPNELVPRLEKLVVELRSGPAGETGPSSTA
jgi:glycosyltransferase (activator-dependent family)